MEAGIVARGRKTRRGAAIGLAVMGAGVACVVFAVPRGNQATTSRPAATSASSSRIPFQIGVVSIDPRNGAIEAEVPGAGGFPGILRHPPLAAGQGAIWTTFEPSLSGQRPPSAGHTPLVRTPILRIDPATGNAVSFLPSNPGGFLILHIAVGKDAIWAVGRVNDVNDLVRLDPSTNHVRIAVNLERLGAYAPTAVLAHGATVWVADTSGTIIGVDARAGQPDRTIKVGRGADGLAFAAGDLWIMDRFDGQVIRLDPKGGEILRRIPVPGSLDAIAAGMGRLWVLDSAQRTVTEIDPATDEIIGKAKVGSHPTDIAIGLGKVWVTNQGDETLSRIDPLALTTERISVGAPVSAIALDRTRGKLWVAISPPVSPNIEPCVTGPSC